MDQCSQAIDLVLLQSGGYRLHLGAKVGDKDLRVTSCARCASAQRQIRSPLLLRLCFADGVAMRSQLPSTEGLISDDDLMETSLQGLR